MRELIRQLERLVRTRDLKRDLLRGRIERLKGAIEWGHVATLDFTEPLDDGRAEARFREFSTRLAQRTRSPFLVARAFERYEAGLVSRIVALLARPVNGKGRLTSQGIKRRWSEGAAKVREFDPRRGLRIYLHDHDVWMVGAAVDSPVPMGVARQVSRRKLTSISGGKKFFR